MSRKCVTDEVSKEILSTRVRLGRYDTVKTKIVLLKASPGGKLSRECVTDEGK